MQISKSGSGNLRSYFGLNIITVFQLPNENWRVLMPRTRKVFDFKVSSTGSDINPQSDGYGSDVLVNPQLLLPGNNL